MFTLNNLKSEKGKQRWAYSKSFVKLILKNVDINMSKTVTGNRKVMVYEKK